MNSKLQVERYKLQDLCNNETRPEFIDALKASIQRLDLMLTLTDEQVDAVLRVTDLALEQYATRYPDPDDPNAAAFRTVAKLVSR